MSLWTVGLALAAGYLINKNLLTSKGTLENSESQYYSTTEPATDGTTTAEIRQAWTSTAYNRFGDFREDLSESQKLEVDRKRKLMRDQVEAFEAPVRLPEIEGVMLTFERSEY